jgi:hypothetical protein
MDSILNTCIMPKIITSPSQCAYRSKVGDIYFCEHPSLIHRYCTWINDFPDGCPLPNGITTSVCKQYNTLYTKIHKHKEPKK